jgi:hypothetical protein
MAIDFGLLNEACLSAFGQAFILLSDTIGVDDFDFVGIPSVSVEEESSAPGQGSVYLDIWVHTDDFTTLPVKGNEVQSAGLIYVVVDTKQDAEKGFWLRLRKDREVTP